MAIYEIKDIKNSGYPVFVHDHNMSFFDKVRIKICISPKELPKNSMIAYLIIRFIVCLKLKL
jgi:hypothetical protein